MKGTNSGNCRDGIVWCGADGIMSALGLSSGYILCSFNADSVGRGDIDCTSAHRRQETGTVGGWRSDI